MVLFFRPVGQKQFPPSRLGGFYRFTSNKEANASDVYSHASVQVLLLNPPCFSVSGDAALPLFYCSTNASHLRLTKKPARCCGGRNEKPFLSAESPGFCQRCYQASASVRARSRPASLSAISDLVVPPLLSHAPRHSQHHAPDGRCQIPSYPVSSALYEYLQSGGAFAASRLLQ